MENKDANPTIPAFVRVRNFERFQHYKDRGPSWIKLYTDLLTDYDFGRLPDGQKAALLLLWLLAGKMGNRLPNDPAFLSRVTGVGNVDVALLLEGRWLEPAPAEALELFPDRGGPGGGGEDASASPEDASAIAEPFPLKSKSKSKSKNERQNEEGGGGIVLTFPTVGGSPTWDLREGTVADFRASFPTIDVEGEVRKALGWVLSNPSRRKTPGGMARFLFSWLSRANDRRPANLVPPPRLMPAPAASTVSKWADAIARKTAGGAA